MMNPPPHSTGSAAPLRVMVVDDSAITRGLITRALKDEPGIEIVASAANGIMALGVLKHHAVDVIILDIEMPEMDGITALPQLLEMSPHTKIIMASTLTLRNADISLKALSLGASDYIPKPSTRDNKDAVDAFYRDLRAKVKALGHARSGKAASAASPPVSVVAAPGILPVHPAVSKFVPGSVRMPTTRPQVLAIGSSTGGPQVLLKLFELLKGKLPQIPIFITQHMPPTFTTLLAEHIGQISGIPCAEAKNGEAVQPGRIYLAPGDFHMTIEKGGSFPVIRLNQDAPVNYCRPSVDPMLNGLAQVYGAAVLTAILTGMGHDGLDGSRRVVDAGGTIIAQDEASSVVWGMPKAVAENGLCSAVLPIGEISAYIIKAFMGSV